ncbi:AMP deaminase [Striga asiatica]|uniref:AMP deaminase n=1 Tax=Striga asiatica TaxID=4170 RepID=A0A5A7Q9W4_STRAF|nr:AMP deaminase [Striga asiatica]
MEHNSKNHLFPHTIILQMNALKNDISLNMAMDINFHYIALFLQPQRKQKNISKFNYTTIRMSCVSKAKALNFDSTILKKRPDRILEQQAGTLFHRQTEEGL